MTLAGMLQNLYQAAFVECYGSERVHEWRTCGEIGAYGVTRKRVSALPAGRQV